MKAITIRQPYAWLIIAGHKPVENRTWNIHHRGPLAIHAGVRMHDHSIEEIERRCNVQIDRAALLHGGVIGIVDLVDVVRAHPSPFFDGPFGWVLANPRNVPFKPMRGGQSLFDVEL